MLDGYICPNGEIEIFDFLLPKAVKTTFVGVKNKLFWAKNGRNFKILLNGEIEDRPMWPKKFVTRTTFIKSLTKQKSKFSSSLYFSPYTIFVSRSPQKKETFFGVMMVCNGGALTF